MDRRGFIGSILAACAAPAIVRVESLMRLPAHSGLIFHPDSFSLEAPAIEIVGGNKLIPYDVITRESLQILEHMLRMPTRLDYDLDNWITHKSKRASYRELGNG